MTHQVYLLGYTGKTPAVIKATVERLDAVLLDIRFSPRSRVPQWSKSALEALLGMRYQHVNALGNAAYKEDGPVRLVDYAAGRKIIEASTRPVILLCVCKDPTHCHRTTVGHLLRADGFAVSELAELPVAAKPTQSSFGF